jgi:phage protein D
MSNSSAENLYSDIALKLNGTDAPTKFLLDVIEFTVENSLHLPDVATLVLHDAALHWIDDSSVMPGVTLEIQAKVGTTTHKIFDGEIVELEANFERGTQQLTIRAFDRMHRLARGRRARSFLNVSDADLMRKIAQEVGLTASVDTASVVYPYVFQNDETNLEFLQRRAAALGYLLYVTGKTLYCKAPKAQGNTIKLEWGKELGDFRPRLTTIGQVNKVTVRGWDPEAKQKIVGQGSKGQDVPRIGQTQSGGDLSLKAFSVDAPILVADRPIRNQEVAQKLAQAVVNQKAGSFIEAEGTCEGTPNLIAGTAVNISAVGNRFSGTYFVTSTTHVYRSGQSYTTYFTVSGHYPSTLLNLFRREEEGAASIPRTTDMAGLYIGLVTDNQDPKGQGRVKVKYPWLSDDHTSDWARVVISGGGNERGIEFLPEVNDEVLVGFEMGDIHYPYVLGGLWNGRDAPAIPQAKATSANKVQQRVIRSRTGHMITLDDSDGGGGVTIQDKNGNKVVLDSAANNLTITVQGDASIQAQGNLTLEAKGGKVQIKGMSVNVESQAGQTQIKGIGITADGGKATVDIKGAMINLN